MGRGEGKEWRGGDGRPLFSLTAEVEISLFPHRYKNATSHIHYCFYWSVLFCNFFYLFLFYLGWFFFHICLVMITADASRITWWHTVAFSHKNLHFYLIERAVCKWKTNQWSWFELVLDRWSVFCNKTQFQSNLPKPGGVKWTISASDNDNDIVLLLWVNKQVCWIKTAATGSWVAPREKKNMYQLKLKRFSSVRAACVIISNTRKTKSLYNADLHMISVIQRQDYDK